MALKLGGMAFMSSLKMGHREKIRGNVKLLVQHVTPPGAAPGGGAAGAGGGGGDRQGDSPDPPLRFRDTAGCFGILIYIQSLLRILYTC